MKSELKNKIKKAARKIYPDKPGDGPIRRGSNQYIREIFTTGAEYLYNQGYKCDDADMLKFVEFCAERGVTTSSASLLMEYYEKEIKGK